jgi:hypothetical protein
MEPIGRQSLRLRRRIRQVLRRERRDSEDESTGEGGPAAKSHPGMTASLVVVLETEE